MKTNPIHHTTAWFLLFAMLLGFGAVTPSHALADVKKHCSRCGRQVPGHVDVGDRCPHCGAFFGSKKFVNPPAAAGPQAAVPQLGGNGRLPTAQEVRQRRALQKAEARRLRMKQRNRWHQSRYETHQRNLYRAYHPWQYRRVW